MTPWEHHPALTEDRLSTVAKLIQMGRDNALDRFAPRFGCTGWTVGCEAFAFQCHEIATAAEDHEWLNILNSSMEFVFSIGGVPARFYRGKPDDPNQRTLRQSFDEIKQGALFSDEELSRLSGRPLYRFAVETDFDGSIEAISFVVLVGDTPMLTWQIPLDQSVSKVSPLDVEVDDGVDLAAPTVEVARKERKDGTND
ncbi:hypothetical protein [Aurantiacibacter sp. MUD61]|uniref:hypothetical protein n=1 Tax=Aurantiacibacter sp. MUD61 TaxID=3009083 RepID=UPI0022F02769|nr:hypothetical protein [Aurantiacibacter sp. MUD61]